MGMHRCAKRNPHNAALLTLLTVVCGGSLGGCLDRDLLPVGPCVVSGVSNAVPIQNIDKVDLLFVVDDSSSMKEEQELLRRELPALIRALTTGQRRDGTTFAPIKDLHLGVVSTDLGTPGVSSFFEGCDARGDQGALLGTPAPDAACVVQSATGVPFLSFQAGVDDAERVASDFQCIANLGTEGCGLEQQLESMLRAVTPATDGALRFWGPNGMIETGQADGVNAGFLRPADLEPSLVAVILVTDEEDCSAANPAHFDPSFVGPPNLRCFQNKANLHAIERYVDGLRAIRPDQTQLVLFSAIAGVPPDLVSDEALAELDPERPETYTAHYDRILDDNRMVETPITTATPSDGNLATSCENDNGKAYPARRIVEVARAFGANGLVRSICESSFEGAIDSIVEAIVRQLPNVCLPFELVPNSGGLIEHCGVVWELPLQPGPGAISACSALPYLRAPKSGPARTPEGRLRCEVAQVAVRAGQLEAGGRGWYYDDFSEAVESCTGEQQRISFTEPPPSGVRVQLECAREKPARVRVVEDALDTVPQPQPGDDCRDAEGVPDASLCQIRRRDGSLDPRMRCHPTLNVCIVPCNADAECPPAWSCDDRQLTLDESGGVGICVNPTCGP
jgi:hypothetical protein